MSESEPATVWKRAGWNNSTITSLAVPNGKAALDFWVRAFGAVVVDETLGPNGELFHGVLRVGDTILMASEPAPAMGVEASRVSLYYYVPDTDVAFKRALDAGATQLSPVQDQFWGDRSGSVKDSYGIRWTIATRIKEMTNAEVKEASEKWMAEHTCDTTK